MGDGISRRQFLVGVGGACLAAQGCLDDVTTNVRAGDPSRGDANGDVGTGDASAGDRAADGSFGDRAAGDSMRCAVNTSVCDGCSKCVGLCPEGAIQLHGDCSIILSGQCYWQCRGDCIDTCAQDAYSWGSGGAILVELDLDRCICCGDCVPACSFEVITRDSNRIASIDQALCNGCGDCVTEAYCPLDAFLCW